MNDRTEQKNLNFMPLNKTRDSGSPGNPPQGNKNIDNLDHIPAVLYVIQTVEQACAFVLGPFLMPA